MSYPGWFILELAGIENNIIISASSFLMDSGFDWLIVSLDKRMLVRSYKPDDCWNDVYSVRILLSSNGVNIITTRRQLIRLGKYKTVLANARKVSKDWASRDEPLV